MDFVSIAVVAAADMEEVEVVDRPWFVAGFPIPAYIAPLVVVVVAADRAEAEAVDRHWSAADFPIPAYIAASIAPPVVVLQQ